MLAESKVKDDNFFLVSGWMLNRLNLKGVSLQVFSIIYGFSQDGEGSFTGSLQYLCDFTNASKNTILKALKELVDKGYILKSENTINGVRFCTYKTNAPLVQKLNRGGAKIKPPPGAKTELGGSAKTEPNNKDLDNKENISKDIVKEVIELYHKICVSFPTIRAVSDSRKKAIQKITGMFSLDDLKTVFENAERSSFLKGSDGGWKASFDWLIKESNFLKVLEGNYADKPRYGRKEPVPGWGKPFEPSEWEIENIRREFGLPPTAGDDMEIAARAEQLRQRLSG